MQTGVVIKSHYSLNLCTYVCVTTVFSNDIVAVKVAVVIYDMVEKFGNLICKSG